MSNINNSALDTQALGLVPMVVETSGRGERAYDIYSRSPRPEVSTTIGTSPKAWVSSALLLILLILLWSPGYQSA